MAKVAFCQKNKFSRKGPQNMQPGKKSKKIGFLFDFFFLYGSKISPFLEVKTSIKILMYLYFWGQDIHLIDFPEYHSKNADLFFPSENGV